LKKKLSRNIERDQEDNLILQSILNFAREEKRDSSGEPKYRYKKMGAGKRKKVDVRRFITRAGVNTDENIGF
jgi:hypothetical protein